MKQRGGLEVWTIYSSPSDFPGRFVARKFVLDQPTAEHVVGDTLEAVRRAIPPGLYRIPREPHDDPVIVEIWF